LSVELERLVLCEIGVHLKAIKSRSDVAEGHYFKEHNDRAVHNTNAAAETLFNAVLHLAPNLLGADALNHHGILDYIGGHVVDQIEIRILNL
jgi:hypothetical protein